MDKNAIKSKLNCLVPTLSNIRAAVGAPSVSLGVIHEGEVIFTHHEGKRDVDTGGGVNANTMYLLGSLTKAFVAASCGILVGEGKLDWTKPLSTYVPFDQKQDPVIGQRANLRDALSHSSGLPQIDISWYGADGESIIPPEHLMHVVNHIPVYPDFRSEFHYSNWMYSVAGRIIEAHGGPDAADGWGSFVRKRIFEPLRMTRSATNRSDLPDDNFTEPHTVLDNGNAARLPVPDFSDKTITGASAAVWSTVPDMLLWAKAVLRRLHFETQETSEGSDSPLREISKILSHTSRVTDDTIEENSYGFGWARHQIPSTHLGWLSTNGPQKRHILGKESRPRLLFYHGGQITGYLNSIYLFPETDSAVVVLSNAQGLGDASDWIAQAVIQAMFDLQPALDFVCIAQEAAQEQLRMYTKMEEEYNRHRTKGTQLPPFTDLLGVFRNEDIKMEVEIYLKDEGLRMRINGRESQEHKLSHYDFDNFGFLPASREEKEMRCLVDYSSWEQFLIRFQRNGDGHVVSFKWVMEEDFPPLLFFLQ